MAVTPRCLANSSLVTDKYLRLRDKNTLYLDMVADITRQVNNLKSAKPL